MSDREAFGATFAGAQDYLNTPTYGLPSTVVVEAQHELLRTWQAGGLAPSAFDASVADARAGFASLTGTRESDVAMGGSVSALLGLVAAAIPDGARVAVPAGEFTSVSFPFAAQAHRGVQVVECSPGTLVTQAATFDVVAASVVQSADGAVLDLAALRAAVEGTDTLVVLDATQALGWLQVGRAGAARAAGTTWADVVVAAGYKWLLAPRGCAWMTLSERMQARLVPHAANWYAGEEPWTSIYGLPLRLAADARRFDASPAWFPLHGAGLTLPWLASLDATAVQAHCTGLAAAAQTALGLPLTGSAIITVPVPDAARRLEAAGIRAAVRAGAVRVGFHLYNTLDDVDRLADALA